MDKRPDNVFQFLEVERKPPAKIGLVTRKTAFREIYEPVTEANLRAGKLLDTDAGNTSIGSVAIGGGLAGDSSPNCQGP